ncbi:hypothetical protein GN958_ATG16836, partial [Phytophthora infestans]
DEQREMMSCSNVKCANTIHRACKGDLPSMLPGESDDSLVVCGKRCLNTESKSANVAVEGTATVNDVLPGTTMVPQAAETIMRFLIDCRATTKRNVNDITSRIGSLEQTFKTISD